MIGGLSISDLVELNNNIQFLSPLSMHKFYNELSSLKNNLEEKNHTLLFTDIKT